MKSKDQYGDFGVVRSVAKDISGHIKWECQCQICSHISIFTTFQLKRNPSCPHCHPSTRHYLKSDYTHPAFKSYQAMLQRCTVSTNKDYKNYGGRGIQVCPQWQNSFSQFVTDMGPRPKNYTLDRIDYNGNYEPGNCRWAPAKLQAMNRRAWYESKLSKVFGGIKKGGD